MNKMLTWLLLSVTILTAGTVQAWTWDIATGDGSGITDGSGTWGAANMWNNGSANTTWADWNDAVIGGGTNGSAGTITMAAQVNATHITFNTPNGGGFYTINGGGNIIQLDQFLTPNASATINASIKLGGNAADRQWTIGSNQTFTLNGNLDGSLNGLIRFGGAGTYVMTGNFVNAMSPQFNNNSTFSFSGTSNSAVRYLLVGRFSATNSETSLFKMNSGAMTVDTGFYIGSVFGQVGQGIVEMAGGSLTSSVPAYIADYAAGTLTLSGGSFVANAGVTLGKDGGNGTVNLNSGSLSATSVARAGGTATVNLNGGTLTELTNSTTFMQGLTLVNVRDGGAMVNDGGYAATIGQALLHSTIDGDNVTDGGLIKSGAGTLTLSGANSYNGPTTVASGTLLLGSGGHIDGTVQANAGATFGGSGSAASTVTIANGASLAPGGPGTAGTLVCGDLALGNGTNTFDLKDTSPGGNNDLVICTNNLTANGTVIAVNTLFPLSSGNYTLIRYTNSLTGSGFSPVILGNNTRFAWTLDATSTPHVVYLNVSGAAGVVTWRPSVSGDWDVQTSTNWSFGGLPSTFFSSDSTLFDDTGAGTNTVNLTAPVSPGSLSVNSASNYTFTGAGKITGLTGLTKSGAGTLTLVTSNDFTGATSINAGTLVVSNTMATSATRVNGGTLNILAGASGSFATNINSVDVGDGSAGTLTMVGGAVSSSYLWIGGHSINGAGSSGTFSLSGGTYTVTSPDYLIMGEAANGIAKVAQFTQSGGAFVNNGIYFVIGDFGVAQMDLSAGSFTSTALNQVARLGNHSGARGTLNVSGSAVVRLNNGLYLGAEATAFGAVNLSGTSTLGLTSISKGSGTATFTADGGTLQATGSSSSFMQGLNAAMINGGGLTVDSGAFTVTISQPLLAGTGTGGLTKAGAGTLVLTGSSTYAGSTTINAGTLQLGNGAAYPTGIIGGMGNITNNAALIVNQSDSAAMTNRITGFGSLTKLGTNSLALFGNNNYTGTTTVASGILAVYNTSASGTGSGPVNLASNTVLTGTGSALGLVTAVGGATVAAGDWASSNAVGSLLTVGAAVIQSNAMVAIRLKGAVADKLQSAGNITLQPGAVLSLSQSGGGALSSVAYPILVTTGGSITGAFAGYPDGFRLMVGANPLVIHYTQGSVYLSNPNLGTLLLVQ